MLLLSFSSSSSFVLCSYCLFVFISFLCLGNVYVEGANPTIKPTIKPTLIPTTKPTTARPTVRPSLVPTPIPSVIPTPSPTALPTIQPSPNPTSRPSSSFPTSTPSSSAPSSQPTISQMPTSAPSKEPVPDILTMSKTFFVYTGLFDNSWFLFILVTIFSANLGKNVVFQKLQIPVITGYMFLGFLCGPYALSIMSVKQVSELGYVNNAALSFIAFSAGAEIYLPEIMPLIKSILWLSLFMISFTMVLGTIFTFSMASTPLLPWMQGYNSCNFGVSALVATILSARSPTSILAVVRELKASGPITHIMIGITVAGDVFILTIFAIVQAMTFNFCSGDAFNLPLFIINVLMIPGAVVWGFLLGYFLIFLLNFKKLKHLILPIGFLTVLLCNYILAVTSTHSKFGIDFDSLLVCIAAGYVVGNSSKRERIGRYFKSVSMYVFIPFFTQVGLMLNMPVLIASLGFSILASLVRAIAMFLGTSVGGRIAGLPMDKALRLWTGLLPQAGVSLGLAGIIGEQFHSTFGSSFQSTMVGVILVNQIIGPLGAKYLIKYAHEDGKGDEHEEHFKATAEMMQNDGHIEHSEPVLMDTQTDEAIFTLLATSTATADDVAGGKDEIVTDEGTLSGVEQPSYAKVTLRKRTKVTPGGILILRPPADEAAEQSKELGPRKDADIVKELVMSSITNISKGGIELFNMGTTGYSAVARDESSTAVPTAAGPTVSNPLVAVVKAIIEKEN